MGGMKLHALEQSIKPKKESMASEGTNESLARSGTITASQLIGILLRTLLGFWLMVVS